MNENSLTHVIGELETIFSKLNKRFFDGLLDIPVITVSPDTTKGAYGWCTSWKAWTPGQGGQSGGHYEINLCAEYLNRTFSETCGTMLHEMIHLLNVQEGVQDTSRSGMYHNKRFKATAERYGLEVEKSAKYGWCITKMNAEAINFVDSLDGKAFTMVRTKLPKKSANAAGSSSRKYVCPQCGAIVRATKEVHITCTDCEKQFELQE